MFILLVEKLQADIVGGDITALLDGKGVGDMLQQEMLTSVSLVGNSLSRPLTKFKGHFEAKDMSLKCPRTFMPKKSAAPKSFEDICPVLSFLGDII